MNNMTFKGKNFITLQDYAPEEINNLINKAIEFKKRRLNGILKDNFLKGKKLCMIFQKPSTRTRISFEVAMYELGGYAITLNANEMQLGRGETIYDTGKTISRYCDAIMARVYEHNDLLELSKGAENIPVINGLSNLLHPCQILADLMTIKEKKGKLSGLKLAYIGDGNNVANSLLIGCSKMGLNISIGCPSKYKPNQSIIDIALRNASKSGIKIEIIENPEKAVYNADIIYTDTWISMGYENEKKVREQIFKKYQVNCNLLKYAKEDVIIMHCLPAHRGQEITNDVIDDPNISVVFDQAENRLHVQKSILYYLLK